MSMTNNDNYIEEIIENKENILLEWSEPWEAIDEDDEVYTAVITLSATDRFYDCKLCLSSR